MQPLHRPLCTPLVSRPAAARPSYATRRGSTLLIVLALMGLLATLGFLFYTFAAQEHSAATSNSDEARILVAPGLEPDNLFDLALEQLILGPTERHVHSALWGGRHSLAANMLGRDGVPFNGQGVHLVDDGNGVGAALVDQDYDNVAESGVTDLREPNDSPAANGGALWASGTSPKNPSNPAPNNLPEPDTDYTYPDINNMFLAYRGMVRHPSTGNMVPVLIPSFHRPQYLRNTSGFDPAWQTGSQKLSLRPHSSNRTYDTSTLPTTEAGLSSLVVPMTINAAVDSSSNPISRYLPDFPMQGPLVGGVTEGIQHGIWEGNAATPNRYDMDLDGDGIREAILLDLDLPAQRRGDGTLVYPMVAFTVYDANGLINLNASLSRWNPTTPPDFWGTQEFGSDSFGNAKYITGSNQGLTPFEINPIYALSADPTAVSASALQQHRYFLTSLPMSIAARNPSSARELGNMEWFFLNYGRMAFHPDLAATGAVQSAIVNVLSGKLGEIGGLQNLLAGSPGALPKAATQGLDDNQNGVSPQSPPLGQPLDYYGAGNVTTTNLADFGQQLQFVTNGTQPFIGPNRWLRYSGYHQNSDVMYGNGTDPLFGLMSGATNQTVDEPAEVVADAAAIKLAKTLALGAVENDVVFGPAENAYLQIGSGDRSRNRAEARVAQLAPVNFGSAPNAADIRSRFTTVSTDRREFGHPFESTRNWESALINPTGAPLLRRPLLRVWSTDTVTTLPALGWTAADPIHGGYKLPLDGRILVDVTGDPIPAGGSVQNAFLRPLTPHPLGTDFVDATPVPSGAQTYTGLPPNTAPNREYWARRDRQAMARDIYTLLYVLGAGVDASGNPLNPLAGPTAFYTDEEMRMMAQFAVNAVDAIDRDNTDGDSVITRFEYDTNLSNGWNLDDDPYTDTDTDRAEVWGVEAQQLTLSEVLAIRAKTVDNAGTPTDHPRTEYDDQQDRYFAYIELRNASPYDVALDSRAWQVRISSPPVAPAERRVIPFRATDGTTTIGAGELFTIMTAGDDDNRESMTVRRSSHFMVDPDGSGLQPIAPPVPRASLQKNVTLDLIETWNTAQPPASFFEISDEAGNDLTSTPGAFFRLGVIDPSGAARLLNVELWRRAHPTRPYPTTGDAAEEGDNPWVRVDVMDQTHSPQDWYPFDLVPSDSTTEIQDKLNDLVSRLRNEPFGRRGEIPFTSPGNVSNNLAQENSTNAGRFSQLHFDRPIASVAELLQLPVVGPDEVTNDLRVGYFSPESQWSNYDNVAKTAAAMFLAPQYPTNGGATSNVNGNRWYRFLDFVEPADLTNRHQQLLTRAEAMCGYDASTGELTGLGTVRGASIQDSYGWLTNSGKINLNTMRHPEVLAGLLDDQAVLNAPNSNTEMFSRNPTDGRDWWQQFLKSRDASYRAVGASLVPMVDPVTQAFVPGTVFSRPFRSLAFSGGRSQTLGGGAESGRDKLNQTVLRMLPVDDDSNPEQFPAVVPDPEKRLLFEVGAFNNHETTVDDSDALDPYARYRLLSKVLNNTTTRSNTFFVFVGVQFHEAQEIDNGSGRRAVRIGRKLDDMPIHRGFFVVDRSPLVEQVRTVVNQTGSVPVSGSSFRYRADTNGGSSPNGLRWRDTILYRQILN